MKRFILLTAILGVFSLSAVAQQQNARTITVKGYVQDAEGQSLQGAVVQAVSESASTKAGADGTFQLDVTSYCKYVEASYEGYVSAQAEIDGSMIIFRLKVDKKYASNKAKAEKAAQKEAAERAKVAEAARIEAEKEAARIAAEKEAARILAEKEAMRIAAEKEAARVAAEKAVAEEAARIAAEKEKERLAAEAKAKAEEEARVAAEKAKAEEAARIAAEQEKARLIAEAKAKAAEEARIAAEKAKAEEAARIAAEQEKERLAAEAKAKAAEEARIAAEQEKARIIAEAKATAEEERARIIAEAKEAAKAEVARLLAEQQATMQQPAPQQVVAQPVQPQVVVQPTPQATVQQPVTQPQPQVAVQQTAPKKEYIASQDEDMVPLEKKPNKPLKKNRFGQMLEFGFMATTQNIQNIEALDMALSLNYAIGCNFNNIVFLGVGTGIIWNIDGGLQEMGMPDVNGGNYNNYYPEMEIGALPLATFSIPAYLHFRVNMSRDTKVAPYFALTGGAEFSPIREEYHPTPNHQLTYNQMTIFGKASLGINFRIGQKSAIYVGVGYRIDNRWGARIYSGDSQVYPNKYFVHGVTANLGFLF